MKGAALLHNEAYEEVEHDHTATGQAAAVVGMVAIAQGAGAVGQGTVVIILGVLGALAGWVIWAGMTYLIGDKLLGGTATWGELLRTLGFAQSPGVLYIFIPLLGGVFSLLVVLWILTAGIIAIRQALDFGTGKALLTAFFGWLALAIPTVMLAIFAGTLRAIAT
jgi:hypothetical protein